MYTDPTPYTFYATLQNETGESVADGTAIISVEDRTLTFQSDFVPLYPIGTAMQVVRYCKNKVVHRFLGSVFLSDKTLMRLVSIADILYPGAEYCYWDIHRYKGTVKIKTPAQPQEHKLFQRFRTRQNPQTKFPITITAITLEEVLFQVSASNQTDKSSALPPRDNFNMLAEIGDVVSLHFDTPLPSSTVKAIVQKSLIFGEEHQYLCNVQWDNISQKEAMQTYLWGTIQKDCTLFPSNP